MERRAASVEKNEENRREFRYAPPEWNGVLVAHRQQYCYLLNLQLSPDLEVQFEIRWRFYLPTDDPFLTTLDTYTPPLIYLTLSNLQPPLKLSLLIALDLLLSRVEAPGRPLWASQIVQILIRKHIFRRIHEILRNRSRKGQSRREQS